MDRAALVDLLGHAHAGNAAATLVGTTPYQDVVVEDLRIAFDSETIPAYLTRPPDMAAPRPAVLYCHAHGNDYAIGRRELLDGRPALADPPYGAALAQRGYVALCLEMPTFGARASPPESALNKALLWEGRTLFAAMLRELAAGLDVLAARDDVDADRIATLGFSMGGTHAYWLAALELRVCAAVHLCCFADLRELIAAGAHDRHGAYMTVPSLLRLGDLGDVAGLVAPRPQLVGVGRQDALTPPAAFEAAHTRLATAYRSRPERLVTIVEPDSGHAETAAMRAAVLSFLDQWLQSVAEPALRPSAAAG